MRIYVVEYRMIQNAMPQSIEVVASNAPEAYDKAFYEAIPQKEGEHAYSAWVSAVKYINGNMKEFFNFEGKPY